MESLKMVMQGHFIRMLLRMFVKPLFVFLMHFLFPPRGVHCYWLKTAYKLNFIIVLICFSFFGGITSMNSY